MGKTYSKPHDSLGTILKQGSIICYAVTAGRAAMLKFGVLVEDPSVNKSGKMKLKVRPVYDPGTYHGATLVPEHPQEKTTSIECGPRVFATGMTEEDLRKKAQVFDAFERLGGKR